MKSLCRALLGSLPVALVLVGPVLMAWGQEKTEAGTRQYAAAAGLQNRGVYELAAEEWVKFIEQYKTDPRIDRAFHYLGVCYLKTDQFELARQSFQTAIDTYPNSDLLEASYLYLGVAQYRLGQSGKAGMYLTAAETFNSLISKYPKGKHLAQAIFYRGECFYGRGKKKEAAQTYALLLDKFPNDALAVDALYALGVTQEELGQHEAAGKSYDAFLKRFPNSSLATEVRMRRGETLFASGQYSAAAQWFAAAAATKGFTLADHATIRQAASLAQMKQHAQAAALYASVPQTFPKSEHVELATLAGGKCHYLAGGYAQARGLLDKLLASGGRSAPEAAHWIARSLLKENKPAEALAVVEKVLPQAGKSPHKPALLIDQADATYEIADRRGHSVELYAKLASEYPKDPVAPEALYIAGFAALGLGDCQAAQKYSSEFLYRFAQSELAVDVICVAAESRLQLGQPAEAEKLYGRLLKTYPNHTDAESWKVRRGLALHLQKKYPETIAAVEAVLAELRTPDAVAEAQYLLGSSRAELRQFDAAMKPLEASLAAAPKWRQADDVLLVLAHAYHESGKVREATASLRKLIAEFPNSRLSDRAYYRLGEYALAEGDFKTAGAEYQRVADDWPESPLVPHALYGLGWARLSGKDYAGAETAFSTLVKNYPKDKLIPRARYSRAVARQQLGKFLPAVEDVQALLAADPSPAEKSDARYVLGCCQVGLKKHAEAVVVFRALLKEDPKYAGADKVLYELSWALKSLGKDADAAKTFGQLAETYPDSQLAAESHHHLGEFEYDSGRFDTAAVAYYAAMQKAGKTPLGEKAAHKLGWAFYRQEMFSESNQAFGYQRARFPKGPLAAEAALMEAECLMKQEKYKEALAAYALIENLPSEESQALALLHSAQAAGQLKKWEQSLELLSECVEQFPDSPHLPEVLYEQGWAQQNLGKPDKAMKLYESVLGKTNREVAARAQFMIGELFFQKKDHAEAVKAFFKVIYGYSYAKWQAEATVEAARCFEVLNKRTQAVNLYQELIKKHPKSDKVSVAKKRIEAMKK